MVPADSSTTELLESCVLDGGVPKKEVLLLASSLVWMVVDFLAGL